MIKNRCLVCGSFNLRADRALSGRLICTSCGNPYGVRKVSGNKVNNINLSSIKTKTIFYFFLVVFVFILIVI